MASLKTGNVTSEGVKSVGGFFRAFDIAFFMPGAIVLFALWWFHPGWWSRPQRAVALLEGGSEARGWLLGLVFVVALVIAAFVTGLFCHALARILRTLAVYAGDAAKRHPYRELVRFLFEHPPDTGSPALPPPPSTGAPPPKYDREASQLSLYLWNLSSLGWNLAVAFLLVPLLRGKVDALAVPWLLGALLVAMLGSDFRFFSVGLSRGAT